MEFHWWFIPVGIGGLVFIFFIIKFLTRKKGDSVSSIGSSGNIFDRGLNAMYKFKECCTKKVNGLFGGGS